MNLSSSEISKLNSKSLYYLSFQPLEKWEPTYMELCISCMLQCHIFTTTLGFRSWIEDKYKLNKKFLWESFAQITFLPFIFLSCMQKKINPYRLLMLKEEISERTNVSLKQERNYMRESNFLVCDSIYSKKNSRSVFRIKTSIFLILFLLDQKGYIQIFCSLLRARSEIAR